MTRNDYRHSLNDCLESIRSGGTRCRTCGKTYRHTRQGGEPGYCRKHKEGKNNEMAVLGRIAVKLQDWFHKQSAKRYEERNGRMRRLGELTPLENWMWTRTRAAWLQCENSLSAIAPRWDEYRRAQNDIPNGLRIKSIQAMKFNPEGRYVYRHCIFVVSLTNGNAYVVDPTGIQFGPEWPLVCRLFKYGRRFMHHDRQARNLQLLSLETEVLA